MRLIDADLMEWASPVDLRFLSGKHYKSVLNILCSQPTVDAIIPVYCTECIHRESVGGGKDYCCVNMCACMGYCSVGERKESTDVTD